MRVILPVAILASLSVSCASDPPPEPTTGERHSAVTSPDEGKKALRLLADNLIGIGESMAKQETPLIQVLQHLPISSELEFNDDDDLDEFKTELNRIVDALIARIDDGQLNGEGEVGVPSNLLCSLTGFKEDDARFKSCTARLDQANLRAVLGFRDGGFTVALRIGESIEPVRVILDANAIAVDLNLTDARAAIDALLTLFELDVGQKALDDILKLEGRVIVGVEFSEQLLQARVVLSRDIDIQILNSHLRIARPPGETGFDLASVTAGDVVSLGFNLGSVSADGPIGLLAEEVLGKDAFGTLSFAGLKYQAHKGKDETVAFTAIIGDLLLKTDGEKPMTVLSRQGQSGAITGTLDGKTHLNRFDLRKGWQTTYDKAVVSKSTRLGLDSVRTIAAGSEVIDYRRSMLAKQAARVELIFEGELTKVEELLCVKEGEIRIDILGDAAKTLTAIAGEDDNCIVGYFTKVNGKPVYHLQAI